MHRHAKFSNSVKTVLQSSCQNIKATALGETVPMHLPGQITWSAGVCTGLVGPRSYEVKIGDSVYRRNRCQLIHANEPPRRALPIVEPQPTQLSTDINTPEDNPVPSTESTAPPIVEAHTNNSPCRSGRVTKIPKWMEDYVLS